jgi:hypothetical protein
MVVPVTGTIPDSTLSPFQVRQKFAVQSLGGLGDWCSAQGGICEDPDPTTGDCYSICDYPTPTIPGLGPPTGTLAPLSLPSGIATSPVSVTSGATATGSYMSGGSLVTTYSDGTFTKVDPSGAVYGYPAGSSLPPRAQGTVTQAQANTWGSLITALSQAGVKLGTVAMLQPGQTLLPNGTILGSGQTLVGGNTITSNPFTAILSNPMLLIGGFGVLAVLVLAGGRR